MRWGMAALVLIGFTLSGCTGESPSVQGPTTNPENVGAPQASAIMIVDYYSWNRFGTDFVASEYLLPWCNEMIPNLPIEFNDKWELRRLSGHRVTENHTELVFEYKVDDLFVDAGVSGHRFGAYYNHTLIYWSESFKEDATFAIDLNGMHDRDKDARWTFFGKLTDPTTEDDEDACTSGFTSGEYTLKVTAV